MPTIILIPANFHLIQNFYRENPEFRVFSWLYLSKDVTFFTKLQTTLPADFTFADTGEILQKIAHNHRQDFIDYIGSLSVRNNSLSWWLTSVSEKNPFVSTVFLNFCYLKIIEKFTGSSDNLVIICDSDSLINAARHTFSSRPDFTIRVVDSRISQMTHQVSRRVLGIVKKGFFIIRFICRISVAKCFALMKGSRGFRVGQKKNALHSWTDGRSFASRGKFRDAYFGDLGSRIKKHNSDFFIISYVLPTIFYPEAVMKLTRCNDKVFLFEEFLSFGDVFRSVFSILVKLSSPTEIPPLDSIELSSVIKEEIHKDRFESSRSETALLHYYAGMRMALHGDLKTLIYTFENHMWEKMLCAGIRKSPESVKLIGYAHSVISPMYLFYSLADLERDIVPLPDYILVNGSLARDRLVAAGLDSGKLHISGALRYEYLKNVRSHGTTPGSDKVILVIPASGFNETVELITKVLQAFEGSGNLRLIIKLHPTIPADTIMKNFSTLPENFSFSQEPVETLLDRTDLLLFSETAVSIEALARHIPILHIKSDFRIDMNLFEGISFVSSVRTPEEIRVKATELLSPSGTENFAFDETVTAFFAPVDEKIVEIFFHHEQTMD